ncbi:MAG: LLM class flavin-dependent oxidoreductase [Hyphomicrobiaceae bacterium]
MIRLSVLDQSVAVTGRSHAEAIRESLELAQFCELLGYARYWVSEHHSHETIAGSAPEILMAAIAATTKRIRIGSAGVMLPHYAPLKIAEQFLTLEALAPGRIDLGVGRAPGSDGRTAFALHPDAARRAELFPEQIKDLISWTHGSDLGAHHPFRRVKAHPECDTVPEIWVLGTSDYGARVAARFGLPYCFAHFITDGIGAEQAIDLYRAAYQPSTRFPEPTPAVCVWALASDTTNDAQFQFRSRAYARLLRDRGLRRPIGPPDAPAPFEFSRRDEFALEQIRKNHIVGDAGTVATELRNVATSLGVEDVVILTWAYGVAARRRSYRLIAQAFDLGSSTCPQEARDRPEQL